MAITKSSPAKSDTRATLGTFAGVFTPSILTILGIILFRRLGYVVGSAGLERALVIIALSSAISALTAISLSAIATNLKVKGGGPYYLISRTLGVEFGGAIGIVLFFAQSVSIAFYCIGFSEAVAGLLPENGRGLEQIIAGLAVVFLFGFAWLGADWATRFQFVIMAFLGAALVSFFAGGAVRWDPAVLEQNWMDSSGGADFWIIFAIFFPAVTGFTQGVSMSGDLKDPGRSIQIGTLWAVGLSVVVYCGAAIIFAAALPANELTTNYEAIKRVARWAWLVDAGVIAATLSSAMASFLGAPRILQSIAQDRVFPFLLPFAQGSGETQNPRRGVLLCAGIAIATVGLGSLNVIAPVVSMFFLISYALLNYATFYETRAASPSFRPRFRLFDARLSLLGAAGCLGAMIAIDVMASAFAVAVLFAVYQYIKNTAGPARWADSRRSYHFQRIRENLLAMVEELEHPRDWRPCILAFCEDPSRRERLLRFASWIEGGSGLTTAVQIAEGEGEKTLQQRAKADEELRKYIAERELEVFSRVIVAPDFRVGVETLIQSFGVGGIRANMVLLSRVDQIHGREGSEAQIRYGRELQETMRLNCNVVVLDAEEGEWSQLAKADDSDLRIDVWWWGDRTSHLMLLLAYLMTRTERWGEAQIKVLLPSSKEAAEKALDRLRQTLDEVRIDAEPEVVLDVDAQAVEKHSAGAGLVFFPLRFRELQLLAPMKDQVEVEHFLNRLPVVALTLAAEDIDLGAEPDEGKAAEIAATLDAASDAEKAALAAEQEALGLAERAQAKLQEWESKRKEAAVEVDNQEAQLALQEAESLARSAAERASEARAQAKTAALAVEELGIKVETEKETVTQTTGEATHRT